MLSLNLFALYIIDLAQDMKQADLGSTVLVAERETNVQNMLVYLVEVMETCQ